MSSRFPELRIIILRGLEFFVQSQCVISARILRVLVVSFGVLAFKNERPESAFGEFSVRNSSSGVSARDRRSVNEDLESRIYFLRQDHRYRDSGRILSQRKWSFNPREKFYRAVILSLVISSISRSNFTTQFPGESPRDVCSLAASKHFPARRNSTKGTVFGSKYLRTH